jgi:response regulator RpfG family c-di-GMP phosphodiesterase
VSETRESIAKQLQKFLSGEAKNDSWGSRRARLLAMQVNSRPGVELHARRVADNALLLALDIGMAATVAATIHEAAMLHDVGKLAVSTAILHKNGPLDADERYKMQLHAAYGFGLLDVPGAPEIVLDVTKYHHERYMDGQGYFGVAGEHIPFAARIVTVADVHEALTARREYKPPMPEGEALSMMTAKTDPPALGRAAFDPFLLRRFVAMRLRDPSLAAAPSQRTALEEFSRSDPMSDLKGRRDVDISRTGQRLHFEMDGSGNRKLLAMTRPDGSTLREFPRLAAEPEFAPAPSI